MNITLAALISSVIIGMVPRAMPILAGAVGETVSENAGILNLGVEGIMLMGAVTGFVVDYATGSLILAFAAALGVGVVVSSVHALASITFNADQVISGTAIWFLGWGLSGVIFVSMFGNLPVPPSVAVASHVYLPVLSDLPVVGPLIFGEDPFFYLLIAILIGVHFFLFHTKQGLNLRAVGENPAVAEIMGVNVTRYRYASVLFGGLMAGFGGAYLVLSIVGSFYFDITVGAGFIAVALVYFGKWKTPRVFIGSLIFGAVYVLYYSLESVFPSVPYEFFAMWPYIATLVIIILVGSKARAPDSLAKPYSKE